MSSYFYNFYTRLRMSFLKALNVPKILRLVLYFKYYNFVCFKLEKKIRKPLRLWNLLMFIYLKIKEQHFEYSHVLYER